MGSASGEQHYIPTTILPTERALRLVIKRGRSIVAVLGLLKSDTHRDTRRQLKRLRARVRRLEELIESDVLRQRLMIDELGALEEARCLYEQADGDDLLLNFLGQRAPPQEWHPAHEQPASGGNDEAEVGVYESSDSNA